MIEIYIGSSRVRGYIAKTIPVRDTIVQWTIEQSTKRNNRQGNIVDNTKRKHTREIFIFHYILEVYWFVDSDLIRCKGDTINLKLVTGKKKKLVENRVEIVII